MIKYRNTGLLIVVFCTPIYAEIYKCPSPDGSITFSQNLCVNGFRKEHGKWINIKNEMKNKIKEKKEDEEKIAKEKLEKKLREEKQRKLEIKQMEEKVKVSIEKDKEKKKTYAYTSPKTYTRSQLNSMISSGHYPTQGSVKTTTTIMSFYSCKNRIKTITSQFRGLYPVKIVVNSSIIYMTKAWTNDAAMTISCSKPDSKMIITQASYL